MNDFVHIVCLGPPSPPDYGGAIDMYYKIEALASAGRKIILHYFDYGEGRGVNGLEKYCYEINAYKRKGAASFSLRLPYIVSSRMNNELCKRLNQDNYPVLLEGVHCSGLLLSGLRDQDRVVIRMHNDEAAYYARLSGTESSWTKKIYFKLESSRLKTFYARLAGMPVKFASLSESDMQVFSSGYHLPDQHFIPCFIPWRVIRSREGKGNYCLYHGNLKVAENEAAAVWLIKKVFRRSGIVLVIAGSGISPRLKKLSRSNSNIKLIDSPSMLELDELIREAHINVLPSMNTTGVKLKILHALFEGRFCVTNTEGLKGSGIEDLAAVVNGEEDFRKKVLELYEMPFTEEDKKNRQKLLAVYNNKDNAQKLSALL